MLELVIPLEELVILFDRWPYTVNRCSPIDRHLTLQVGCSLLTIGCSVLIKQSLLDVKYRCLCMVPPIH